ncbi:MAG TPA: helix-turn-helix domain-containing protein [Propionibacteriaceae bacterium]
MTEVLTAQSSRPSARRAQTRARLMDAAVTVFAERGIIGASVEEICERAGFTRGAFYSNFSGKDELVVALLRHEMETQYSAAEHAIGLMKVAAQQERSAEDLISATLTEFEAAGRAGRDWVLTQQELLLHAARVPQVRVAYQVFSDECLRQLSSLIADAVAYAGLEFSVSFEVALSLLSATHQQALMATLLTDAPLDYGPLRALVLAITRPSSGR